MSGFLSSILLGRPGYEMTFNFPPEAVTIEDNSIAIRQRTLDGTMKKSILNQSMPLIKISSKYITPAQRNQLASLTLIDDTFLSFQLRDDFQFLSMKVTPASLTSIILPPLSCLRLSKYLVDAGFSSIITINSINEVPNPADPIAYDDPTYGAGGYAGAEHYSGGSYADTSYTITPGIALTSLSPVYVTFTYKGWLVDIDKLPSQYRGENVEWFSYDFQLTAA